MNLLSLPDDIILSIFDNIPIKNTFNINKNIYSLLENKIKKERELYAEKMEFFNLYNSTNFVSWINIAFLSVKSEKECNFLKELLTQKFNWSFKKFISTASKYAYSVFYKIDVWLSYIDKYF